MLELPASNALVMVAVVNNPRDLEIARLLGWYRIPLRTAPKVVAVDYLAFFQTGSFGDQRWRIQYVAPVRGHELTSRAEHIRDEADHPRVKEEYFKSNLVLWLVYLILSQLESGEGSHSCIQLVNIYSKRKQLMI